MTILIEGILSFIAAVGFAILFNAPKNALVYSGIAGTTGWTTFKLASIQIEDPMLASFLGAFAVAVVAHLFARRFKTPMIIFSVAGIIPLVPGGTAYHAMRKIVESNYTEAIEYASHAFLISGAIAMGLVFAEVLIQFIFSFINKWVKKSNKRGSSSQH